MKTLYVDLDNTLVNFQTGIDRITAQQREDYKEGYDDCPGIFALMDPVDGATDAFTTLAAAFDTYILSTAPWDNPSAWSDKLEWVHRHIGKADGTPAYKRLILSHHKNLNKGDFLVDDRPGHRGADRFEGEVVAFTSPQHPDWPSVTKYLLDRAS